MLNDPSCMWVHRSGELYRVWQIVIYEYQKGRDHQIQKEHFIDTNRAGLNITQDIISDKTAKDDTAAGIDDGRLVVNFKGEKKTFQFLGAFEQGFLALEK